MDRRDRYPGSPPGDFQFTILFLFLFLLFSLFPTLLLLTMWIEGRATSEELAILPWSLLIGLLLLRAIRDLTDLPGIGRFRRNRRKYRLKQRSGRSGEKGGEVARLYGNLVHFSPLCAGEITKDLSSVRLTGIYRGRRITVEGVARARAPHLLICSIEVSQRWMLRIVREGMWEGIRRGIVGRRGGFLRHMPTCGLILSGDPAPLRAWLASEPERFEERLTFLFEVCHVRTIEMAHQRLTARVEPVHPAAETEPEAIARLLDVLLDLSRTFGTVTVVGPPEPPVRCPYCRDLFSRQEREAIVACRACHTAYHAECWELGGRCGVFGCAGRDAVPASPSSA